MHGAGTSRVLRVDGTDVGELVRKGVWAEGTACARLRAGVALPAVLTAGSGRERGRGRAHGGDRATVGEPLPPSASVAP